MTIEKELTEFVHKIFLDKELENLKTNVCNSELNRWHSLIVQCGHDQALSNIIQKFGEQIYSKLVFFVTKAPDFKRSKMLMIIFTVSGGVWTSVIGHNPLADPIEAK